MKWWGKEDHGKLVVLTCSTNHWPTESLGDVDVNTESGDRDTTTTATSCPSSLGFI